MSPARLARRIAAAAVVFVVVAGCGPDEDVRGPTVTPTPPPNVSLVVPVAVRIPAIGVNTTTVVALHTAPDRTIDMPPATDPDAVGWFRDAPVPGDQGPAILLAQGSDPDSDDRALFAELGELAPGDTVEVDRSDHVTEVFKLTRIQAVDSDEEFPAKAVFAATPIPEIRLITWRHDGGPSGKQRVTVIAYGDRINEHPTTPR
jgi:sortase family protein